MSESTLTDYLTENPRMIGVLFALSLLLMQAGNVAGQGSVHPGP